MEQLSERKMNEPAAKRGYAIVISIAGIVGFLLPVFKSFEPFGESISTMYFFEKFFANDLAEVDPVFFFCLTISFALGVAILISSLIKQPDDYLNLALSAISATLLIVLKKRIGNITFGIARLGIGWYISIIAFSVLTLYEIFVIIKYKRNILRKQLTDTDKLSGFAASLSTAGLVCFLMPFATLPFDGGNDFAPGFIFLMVPFSKNLALFGGKAFLFFGCSVIAMLAGVIAMGKARKRTRHSLCISGVFSFIGVVALLFLNLICKQYLYLLGTGFGWYGAFFSYLTAMICALYTLRLYKKRMPE